MRLKRNYAGLILGLAFCAIPLSIAVTESLLAIALVLTIQATLRHQYAIRIPQVLWLWIPWAALEMFSWLHSPDRESGIGELRHLLLPAAVFFAMPALDRISDRVAVWRGLLVTATIGSGFVICDFVSRLLRFRHELSLTPDPSMYLRAGGLLHHWMIYGTVEVMAFAGLLEFWHSYPEERRHLAPMVAINGLAILLSLTRMLWICSLALLGLHLFRRRSRWIWAIPVLPLVLVVLAPVRARVSESLRPDYYSNAERLQMLRVGWQMIVQHPLTGVGPGRVEKLYVSYLSAADPRPSFHGHLHNNAVQFAAQFGLAALLALTVFISAIFLDLAKRVKKTHDRDAEFLCRAALIGLTGFILTGLFDYTYGHSLGLLFVSFLVLSPLDDAKRISTGHGFLTLIDRCFGGILMIASLPTIVTCVIVTRLLSRRSPLVAHLRTGQNGRLFWMLN